MLECCCCPESSRSDSRSHMINCFLAGTGTSSGLPPSPGRRACVAAEKESDDRMKEQRESVLSPPLSSSVSEPLL